MKQKNKRYILGINSVYHESSACLVKDGKLIAAVEEERFNRKKHAKSATIDNVRLLPFNAINFCLKKAGITMKDVDIVGYSFDPEKRYIKNSEVDEYFNNGDWGSKEGERKFYELNKKIANILGKYYDVDLNGKFIFVPHHVGHLASAFFVTPYKNAAILCVDGIGEFESTSLAVGKENKIEIVSQIDYPHSLGFLWEKFSKYLGFSEYDACKVMGLSSYGDHKVFLKRFEKFIKIKEDGDFVIDNGILKFRLEDYAKIEEILGPKRSKDDPIEKRHEDIAATLQFITEEIVIRLCNRLSKMTKSKNLCLAGGVALNCVVNGKIIEKTPFENVWVQPGANDAGTSIGVAFQIWNELLDNPRSYVMEHAYLGPEFSNNEIKQILEGYKLNYYKPKSVEEETAKLIAEGNIIAWFQGAMEFGPRALGNRSILVDPRTEKMRDILNYRVKHREPFRPFCPSVLKNKANQYFGGKNSEARKYMLAAVNVLSNEIPAVTHIDNTARIQEVEKRTNLRYYNLLKEFEKITGVPVLLNTSFNDQEPIVCTPEDAVKTFLKTNIDHLAIGDFIVSKR